MGKVDGQGIELLNDIKMTVLHALYKRGYQVDDADRIAETARENVLAQFQRSCFYLPNFKNTGIDSREQVLELHAQDKKVAEIVRETGLSSSMVYHYIRTRNRPPKANVRKQKMLGMEHLLSMKMLVAKALLTHKVTSESCKAIGEELQVFICKHWGGHIVTIPSTLTMQRLQGGSLSMGQRNALLFEEYKSGATPADLALKYQLTPHRIREVLRAHEARQ